MVRTAFDSIVVSAAPQTVTDATHGTQAIIGNASYDCYAYDSITVFLTTHSVSGTSPTLDVSIQTSPDKVNWVVLKAMTQATAAGTSMLQMPVDASLGSAPKTWARYIRFMGTVGGTGTPTLVITLQFSPLGEA